MAVIGATGFLGRAIVEQALRQGMSVRRLSRRPWDSAPTDFAVDLGDCSGLTLAMRGARTVIHAAGRAHVFGPSARDHRQFEEVNVRGTENAIRAAIAAGAGRFILLSSVAVYGVHSRLPVTEDHPCAPSTPYAISKLRAEQHAADIATDRIPLTILRLPTVYGEGDPGNIARLIHAIERRRFIQIGDGRNRKTLIHRDDAAAACLHGLKLDGDLMRFNVPGGIHEIRQVVDVIARELQCRVLRLPIPSRAALAISSRLAKVGGGGPAIARMAGALEKWLADDVYDGNRFARVTGFSLSIDLQQGIRRQIGAARQR